jgi:hypothetical protein
MNSDSSIKLISAMRATGIAALSRRSGADDPVVTRGAGVADVWAPKA